MRLLIISKWFSATSQAVDSEHQQIVQKSFLDSQLVGFDLGHCRWRKYFNERKPPGRVLDLRQQPFKKIFENRIESTWLMSDSTQKTQAKEKLYAINKKENRLSDVWRELREHEQKQYVENVLALSEWASKLGKIQPNTQ